MLRIFFITILIYPTYWAYSQVPNELDLFFGDSGKVEIDIDEYDYLSKIEAQDSVIYFAGYTGHYDAGLNYDAIIGRLDYLGNLDTTFSDSGYIRFDFPGDNHTVINDLEIGDSGIYVIGTSLIYGVLDTLHTFVGKYNFNGTLDTSYADSGYYTPDIGSRYISGKGILLTSDNKIVFCGASENNITLTDHPILGRLLPNGSLDTTFGSTGIKIWDSNGHLVDSLTSGLQEKHGAGGYLNEITIVDNNYFFSGYYLPGSNNMCLMIMVQENGEINMNYAGLGYRVFELSPNNENYILNSYYENDTLYSLINVIGNGYGNVTLFLQDTSGVQLAAPTFNIPDWNVEAKDMALTLNGEIAVSGYAIQTSTSSSVDSEGFFVVNMNDQGVFNSNYSNYGFFIESFDSEESAIEDLSYNNGNLFGGGFVSKMVPGNVFDFSFIKLDYNSGLKVNELSFSQLSVYPNPAHDVLKIKMKSVDFYNLQLMGITGEILLEKQFVSNLFNFDISTLPTGIYLISVNNLSTGSIQSKKVIIE